MLGRKVPLLVVAIGLLQACSGAPVAQEGQARVRAVVVPYLTLMPFHIAVEQGLYAARDLDVDLVRLGRNQELMTALASGEVDVAAGLLTVNELSLIGAGARIRMVAAMGQLSPAHCAYLGFVTRPELLEGGALEDPERLRQLVVDADVLIPFGYWLDEALRPFGLRHEQLERVELPSPAAVEALANGSVDLVIDSEPFLTMHRTMGDGVLWKQVGELTPGYVVVMIMYGPSLLDERPEVGERFAVATLEAIRRFNRGKTPANLEIVERVTRMTRQQAREACWPMMSDDARIDPSVFSGYQRWNVEHGLVDRVLADDELYDPRFIEHANAILGQQEEDDR